MSVRLILVIVLLSLYGAAHAQDGVKHVQLKPERIAYEPKEFYVAGVVNDLPDTSSIGTVKNRDNTVDKIVLQYGTAAGLKRYIDSNVKQDISAQAVVLHITKLDVDIKKNGQNWLVTAQTIFSFYIGGNKELECRLNGHGGFDYDPAIYTDKFIRQTLESDLMSFDTTWHRLKNKVQLSSAIKVNVTIGKVNNRFGFVVYDKQRPLRTEDFRGKVSYSDSEKAATASLISIVPVVEVQNGHMVANVTVTPYFDNNKSWFNPEARNSPLLAHEQVHFNITALKACELAAVIRNTTFTKENFQLLITRLQDLNKQEQNDMDLAYDTETARGTIPEKQLEWQRKINEQLIRSGCY